MANYMKHRYLLMTLDPVHIGTGGYRLGGVDNSIVREPGTRIPKIPGTSLSGAIRQYAARHTENDCAGQKGHCGKDSCPICYTFGFVKGEGEEAKARSGVVNIFDAHILFFPVYSMMGPVWVTTRQRLEDAGFSNLKELPAGKALFTFDRTDPLNLGWLMVEGSKISNELLTPPKDWQNGRWNTIQDRLVIVPDNLFGQVVNSNLEVRTSVSINPETGAAESGGLFTYEAIPRSTFLMAEIIQDDYKNEFPNGNQNGWKQPLDVVKTGLKMIEYLGVGGMGTRGFGRVAIVGEPVEKDWGGNNNG